GAKTCQPALPAAAPFLRTAGITPPALAQFSGPTWLVCAGLWKPPQPLTLAAWPAHVTTVYSAARADATASPKAPTTTSTTNWTFPRTGGAHLPPPHEPETNRVSYGGEQGHADAYRDQTATRQGGDGSALEQRLHRRSARDRALARAGDD